MMSRFRIGAVLAATAAFAIVAASALAAPKGTLSLIDTEIDGVGGVEHLTTVYGVTTSPDGKSVYALSADGDALTVFERSKSGRLKFLEEEVNNVGDVTDMDGPSAVGVSPDGKSVYVTANQSNSITTFARKKSGKVRFVGSLVDGVDGSMVLTTRAARSRSAATAATSTCPVATTMRWRSSSARLPPASSVSSPPRSTARAESRGSTA